MRFDMSRAWNDAVSRISANREVMMIVAGVFFLLPSLLFYVLFSDVQTQAMADLQQMAQGKAPAEAAMQGVGASFFFTAFALSLAQLVGFIALLSLLDDRDRPTVGQAIGIGIKSLPTLIGASLLVMLGYILAAFVFGMLMGISAGVAAVTFILVLLLLGVMIYAMVRLSLLLPVVVFERQLNPITALVRSWRLTKGSTMMLFLFYLLLMVVYFVISLLVTGMLLALLIGIMGQNTVTMFLGGLVSGALSAVANMVFTGIIASVYRQLAGPSTTDYTETFG